MCGVAWQTVWWRQAGEKVMAAWRGSYCLTANNVFDDDNDVCIK